MVEAFAAGEIDLGYIGLPPAMIGIDRGIPVRCIGGGHIEGTIMIAGSEYAAAEDSSSVAEVLSQFCGKAIGSPARGSIHDVIIRYLLKRYQIDGVEVKNFSWADLIPAAIAEGEVQGAVGTPQLAVVAQTFYQSENHSAARLSLAIQPQLRYCDSGESAWRHRATQSIFTDP